MLTAIAYVATLKITSSAPMARLLSRMSALAFACVVFAESWDKVTTAPSGEYSIVQDRSTECDACFDTVLHFRDQSKPDVNLTLKEGKFADSTFRAWARYFISPDDRWVLRIQHLGGGENEAFLYSVAPGGQVQRREISRPVFDRIGHSLHQRIEGRTQIELGSWDIPGGLLHLEAAYEPWKHGVQQPWLYFEVSYDLKNASIRAIRRTSGS